MKPNYRKYNFSVNNYTESASIKREDNCNGFVATNLGDTPVVVAGKLLFPSTTPATVQGDSFSFVGNADEVYAGYIQIAFLLPLGAAPRVEIVQKFYLEHQ